MTQTADFPTTFNDLLGNSSAIEHLRATITTSPRLPYNEQDIRKARRNDLV